ncbi:nucleoside monophosphate kinase [Candidatus Azambacteria bacterium]|nr:nucleoside monophosphate kinase [Candidatus Azambacteria bacterium]
MKKKLAIMFIGPPGSGKSSLARIISERGGLDYIDTGELIKKTFSDPKKANDEVIQKAKQSYFSGQLVDPSFVINLVLVESKRIFDSGQGIVFSGSPRTIFEADLLVPFLVKNYSRENVRAFLLNVSEEAVIKRMSQRRVCSNCGLPIMPELKNDRCTICGGEIISKSTDDPQKITIRFKEYNERTKPVINYLKNLKLLIEINAEPLPEEILKEIETKLIE